MKKYFLGLDLGTNSIGWAVTDLNYNLLRKKGKDMWGIREFDRALTSVDRRTNRIARRRRQKEVVRIGLLRSYFADEVGKIDLDFFIRIDNSKYYVDDKSEVVRYKNIVFNDNDYKDKDYYQQYPTIFHLRKELLESEAKHDIRLIYLAIANMFKHRGHFLNENLSATDDVRSMQDVYNEFLNAVSAIVMVEDSESVLQFKNVDATIIETILSDKNLSRSEKFDELKKYLEIDATNRTMCEYVKCISGLNVDGKKLFPLIGDEEKINICFSDFGYEDKIPEILASIGDENYHILELMKEMHDTGVLTGILKGEKYLSISRVDEYEKHKKDLKILKKVIIENKSKKEYDFLFRSTEAGSYSAYVNSVNTKGLKKRREMKGRKSLDLYDVIKKMLKGIDGEEVKYILDEIAKEKFLPKQISLTNSVIPNQVHKNELKKILVNAEKHYTFLKNKDDSGLSVSERILALFSFHVPYYIGPITENSANGWVIRKAAGRVYPWNYEEKIDVAKTSEQFIMRMVRECTYMKGESVLPKASLLYEKYCVLNEINNIKIDGERISIEVKQNIYNDLFKKGKKITRKQLEKYLIVNGVMDSSEQLSGIDISINSSLSSYGKFKAIFGEDIEKDSYIKMIERIIFLSTVYGDSRKILKNCIITEFGRELNEGQLKRILGFKFKDWGHFSHQFLNMQGVSKETGEIESLISVLWNNNINLMEIINSDLFTFKETLEESKERILNDITEFKYEDLDDYYFSAPVKRMIWQSLMVIDEIKKIMEGEPTKIFIEMTRSEQEKGDKGRKDSRKKQLLDIYKNVNDDLQNWKELIEQTDASGKIRTKKMYLYLLQMGRDMYTGDPIELDKLFDDNIYDIDHIYPRSVVKDDNLTNNLVLVKKVINAEKSDIYPVDNRIQCNPKVINLWKTLHFKKLISDEKYGRLTSKKSFTEEQLAGFIARQIVETSQATKGIADILKRKCPESEVVYSKATNVSDFRREFKLFKSRLINDFHHAHDAYLNIVVGNTYNVKFTNDPMNFIRKDYARDAKKYAYHMGKIFERNVVRGKTVGWIAPRDDDPGSIAVVRKMLSRNTPIMTRMIMDGSGALYNLQPIGHSEAKKANYVPLKSKDGALLDVEKYGGYGSLKPAYFVFIEFGKGKKRKKAFDVIPMIYKDSIKSNDDLVKYFEDNGYENVRIIMSPIKKNSLVKLDGYYLYIVGMDSRKNVELHNAVNLKANMELNNYVHNIEVSVIEKRMHRDITMEYNIKLYHFLLDKYKNGYLKNYPKDISKILENGLALFTKLSIEKQVEVLSKILTISAISGGVTDLKEIGGPSSDVGRIRISGNMTDKKELILIRQSVTGLLEKQINLLNI